MRHIGYLNEEWETGKDVWVTVDKLLRAEEEGADEDMYYDQYYTQVSGASDGQEDGL